MRYQQQQARMSPNWREKEAMSTQKLMAATTHLHLKQEEEITRLRRNVSSLAKKNHGLMRQVHELVSRLRQYPPPRIPEDTRPKNQDEEIQEDSSPEIEEDTQMKDTADPPPPTEDEPYSDFEMAEEEEYSASPAPTPEPEPLKPPPSSPPSTTAVKPPAVQDKKINSEEIIPRVVQPPPPEAPIQAETHPDEELEEEVRVMIMNPLHASEAWHNRNCVKHNRRNTAEKQMTYRGWIWYNGTTRTLVGKGREDYNSMGRIREGYSVKAVKRGEVYTIRLEEVREEDREIIAGHNGKYLIGLPGGRGEERERAQIVVKTG